MSVDKKELNTIALHYDEKASEFEINFYKQVLDTVPFEVFVQYNYKMAYFWNFFDLSPEDIKSIHPIIFTLLSKRFYLLPDFVFNNMTEEQIYILNANPINLQYIPITIFKRWLDRDYSHLTKDYLEARKIPIMVKGVDFHEWLTKQYHSRILLSKNFSNLKPTKFYEDVNRISAHDICQFLNPDIIYTYKGNIQKILKNYKGLNNNLIEGCTDVYDYQKVVAWLNEKYSYRVFENLEVFMPLREVRQRVFKEIGYDNKQVLKEIIYIFEYQRPYETKVPRLELSTRTFSYFYEDVIEYIKERLSNKGLKI